MTPTKFRVLELLPPYKDEWQVITHTQDVGDIMADILDSHKEFAPYYDKIAFLFERPTLSDTCDLISDFCKENIRYHEETEHKQTTALPTGILVRGIGDCKHFASFAGGILAAISRGQDQPVNWCYRFASYKVEEKNPYHVFVVATDIDGSEIWIDPTPGAGSKQPVWQVDKRPREPRKQPAAVGFINGGHNRAIGTVLQEKAGLSAAQQAYNNNWLQQQYNAAQGGNLTAVLAYFLGNIGDQLHVDLSTYGDDFTPWLKTNYPAVYQAMQPQIQQIMQTIVNRQVSAWQKRGLDSLKIAAVAVAALATGGLLAPAAAGAAAAALSAGSALDILLQRPGTVPAIPLPPGVQPSSTGLFPPGSNPLQALSTVPKWVWIAAAVIGIYLLTENDS